MMRRTFKALAFSAGILFSIASVAQNLPGLPVLTNFQKIAVSQQSTFQGKVIFDQGLDILG